RTATRDPSLEPRPGCGLRRHGARADDPDPLRRPPYLGHHVVVVQHGGGIRRGRHPAREACGAVRHARRRIRYRIHHRSSARRLPGKRRPARAVLGGGRPLVRELPVRASHPSGLALALAGVSSLIVQGGVIGRVVAALGEYRALLTGLFIGLLGQLLLGLAPTAPLFLAGIPVWSLFGLATPSLQAIASRSVEPTAQGQLQGALASLRSVATLITPILYTQTFAAAIG